MTDARSHLASHPRLMLMMIMLVIMIMTTTRPMNVIVTNGLVLHFQVSPGISSPLNADDDDDHARDHDHDYNPAHERDRD